MKVQQMDTTQANIFAMHDEIGKRLNMEWNSQAVSRKAVFAFFADSMGLEKGSEERVALAKQWDACPAWFGVNISAGKNARLAKKGGDKALADYTQD